MARAKTLNGKDLMLWIDGKVVALSTSCKLSMSAQTGDSSTKDDGMWSESEVVAMEWSATNESVDSADKERTNDMVYDQLFDAFIAGKAIKVTIGIPANKANDGVPEAGWTAPTGPTMPYYTGSALLTALDREGAKGSNGKVSVSLKGVGALIKGK